MRRPLARRPHILWGDVVVLQNRTSPGCLELFITACKVLGYISKLFLVSFVQLLSLLYIVVVNKTLLVELIIDYILGSD